tara:strand:+ start:403 stop:555 length:153 start_codon:yes stop_codon:yes gene_type:complete
VVEEVVPKEQPQMLDHQVVLVAAVLVDLVLRLQESLIKLQAVLEEVDMER